MAYDTQAELRGGMALQVAMLLCNITIFDAGSRKE